MINTLFHETEGNPLFVVEMVRAGTLFQREGIQTTAGNALSLLTQPASTLPPTMQSVLSARLAQLSPLARETANVAAVIGREFTFAVLARASEKHEDAVAQGLDELWQRRIVREQYVGTAESYDFTHDKLREQAYSSLSPTHRRLLHCHIAEALETTHTNELDAVSGQIAAHYERAGLPERAIPFYRRAGDSALRIFANSEAITAFQRAAALLEMETRADRQWETAAAIYASSGDIFVMMGQQQEARQVYQRGLAHVPPREYIWQARLLRKTANTWNLVSDNLLGTSHVNARLAFQEAERLLDQAPDKSSAAWLQEWIDLQIDQLLPVRGSVDEMTAIIEKARPIIELHGSAEQRAQFFQAVIARDSQRDRFVVTAEIVANCRAALAAVQQTGNQGLIGFAHFILGVRLFLTDQLDEAEEELRAAITIAEQIGYTTLLVRGLTFLPFLFRRRGQVEAVREVITRALAVPEARNIPIIKGHQAWVAWRDGKFDEAETYGRASFEEKQAGQNANSFRWAGIWPFIGVALMQKRTTDAMNAVCLLLNPTQQLPPEQTRMLLESALQAWDAGHPEEAHTLLQQAAPLAQQLGYL